MASHASSVNGMWQPNHSMMKCAFILLPMMTPDVMAFPTNLNVHARNYLQRKGTGGNNPSLFVLFDSRDDKNNYTERDTKIAPQPSYTLKKRNPYDVHVYYKNKNEREIALLLRTKMKDQFPWMRFYPPKDKPIGPHPHPMWEADFGHYNNHNEWENVTGFLGESHGTLSVLVHPHSTDGDYDDHTKNAFWAGEVLGLRIGGWKH